MTSLLKPILISYCLSLVNGNYISKLTHDCNLKFYTDFHKD